MIKNQEINYKSLIEKTTDNGDLVILGQKGTCKTTFLMNLARTLREDINKHVIIFETFPKWINEFDNIPYLVIKDSDVQPKENVPYLQEDCSYIQWSKDYTILNAEFVIKTLKENKDLIFLIEAEDMEKISAFMTFVLYQLYRKQYLRAKAKRLQNSKESFWFLCEEAHNLLDSATVQKKTFQKLRKIQNEFRNLNMHLICVALRLQDLSPKIRTKMSILCSRVSLDDYQLKVRSLLRNSKYRDQITQLEKGSFVFPELDLKLTVEPFKQQGTPTQLKPKEIKQPKTRTLSLTQKIFKLINPMAFVDHELKKIKLAQKTQNSFFKSQKLERENLEALESEKEDNELDEDFLSEDSEFMENW